MNIDRDMLFPTEVFKIMLYNSAEINEQILTQLHNTKEYQQYQLQKEYKVTVKTG